MNKQTKQKIEKMNKGFSEKLDSIRESRRTEIAQIDDYYNKKETELLAALNREQERIFNEAENDG